MTLTKNELIEKLQSALTEMRDANQFARTMGKESISHKHRNTWQIIVVQISLYENLILVLKKAPGEEVPKEIEKTIQRFTESVDKIKGYMAQFKQEITQPVMKQ